MAELRGISDAVVDKLQYKPQMVDPVEAKKSRGENERLEALAKTMTEDERKAWLEKELNRKHVYHGVDLKDEHHFMEHTHPSFTYAVIERRVGKVVRYNFTNSLELAQKIMNNILVTKEEHLGTAKEQRERLRLSPSPHIAQEATALAELHERLATEADGKTAEIIPIIRLRQE